MWQSGSTSRRELATLRAIVTVVLPEYPDLDAPRRSAIEQEVAEYVATQIRAMPGFLRVPCRLALLSFALLPMLRYGRSFGSLSRARQAAYVALWSDAPPAQMRDFVKLIRGTALLVYFDHPAVRDLLDAENARTGLRERCEAANA